MTGRHTLNERRRYATLQARASTCWLARVALVPSKKPGARKAEPKAATSTHIHSCTTSTTTLAQNLRHPTIEDTTANSSINHSPAIPARNTATETPPCTALRTARVANPPPGPTPTAHIASAQPWQSNAMALISENQTSSSSNYRRSSSAESSGRRSVTTNTTTASAYVVNAASMGLTGFHYSTCGAGGMYTLSQEQCLSRTRY